MNTNYYHLEPDSHYWDNVETLLSCLEYIRKSHITKEEAIIYLIRGLENTAKNGYDIIKKEEK